MGELRMRWCMGMADQIGYDRSSKPGVVRVVYLAAFLLEPGVSFADKVQGNEPPYMEVRVSFCVVCWACLVSDCAFDPRMESHTSRKREDGSITTSLTTSAMTR
jgi:hypothetical protein